MEIQKPHLNTENKNENFNPSELSNALEPFFENLQIISSSVENGDLETLETTVLNTIAFLDECDTCIPKTILELPIFSSFFSIISQIDNSFLQSKLLELLADIYDNTDDDEFDYLIPFSQFSSIEEFNDQFIIPFVLQDNSIFTMFINLLRSMLSNVDTCTNATLAKFILPSLLERSKILLQEHKKSCLPQAIDFFSPYLHGLFYHKIFRNQDENQQSEEEIQKIEEIISQLVQLYFTHINSFIDPSIILQTLYFYIRYHKDMIQFYINKINQPIIFSLLNIIPQNEDDEIEEKFNISTVVIEILILALEKTKEQFFELIDYPLEVLHNNISYILTENVFIDESYDFLELCFDFIINTIAYNTITAQAFVEHGFLDFLPDLANVSFRVRRNVIEFYYNLIFAAEEWKDKEVFICDEFFGKSLLDMLKFEPSVTQKILNLTILCLQNGQNRDIKPCHDSILSLLNEEPEIISILETLTENDNETIIIQATTILELIEE